MLAVVDGITPGKTPCLICGRAIARDSEALSFVRFIEEASDPLAAFAGGTFHRDCFAAWDRQEEYLARYAAFARAWKDRLS